MKYLFFLSLLFLISCDNTVEPFTENQQLENTTLQIQQNIDTLYQVSIVEDDFYLLIDSLVIHKGELTTNSDLKTNPGGLVLGLFILVFILFFMCIVFMG